MQTIFYPVRRVHDTSVVVQLEEEEELSVSEYECPKCINMLKSSELLDLVEAIDWQEVENLNLKRIVGFGFTETLLGLIIFFRIGGFYLLQQVSRM